MTMFTWIGVKRICDDATFCHVGTLDLHSVISSICARNGVTVMGSIGVIISKRLFVYCCFSVCCFLRQRAATDADNPMNTGTDAQKFKRKDT